MSILNLLKARIDEQQLIALEPLLGGPQVRNVFLTPSVMAQLSPDTSEHDFEMEAGRLRRRLESIVVGDPLVVGHRRDKVCDLKRLDPSSDEVWEIRERPDPGIRVFFRFVEYDCIAATNIRLVRHLFAFWWKRSGADYWPAWRAEIRRCKAIWRNLFVTYAPHSGVRINDYLSNAVGPDPF